MLYRTHRRYTLQTALTIHAPLDPSPIHSADSGTNGAYYTCSLIPIADTLRGLWYGRRLLYMLHRTHCRYTLQTALTVHARLDPSAMDSADSGTDGAYYTCSLGPVADKLCGLWYGRRLLHKTSLCMYINSTV